MKKAQIKTKEEFEAMLKEAGISNIEEFREIQKATERYKFLAMCNLLDNKGIISKEEINKEVKKMIKENKNKPNVGVALKKTQKDDIGDYFG